MKIEEVDIFVCPYCDNDYEEYQEAVDCTNKCADIKPVVEDSKTNFICEYCKQVSHDVLKIEGCERKHEEDQDDFYHHEKLNQVRAHPS